MTLPIIVAAALVITYFAYRVLFGTDTPKIKGIPEIPGQPLFGSLLELGNSHAKVAKGWTERYGPVFQVRLGNKVRNVLHRAYSHLHYRSTRCPFLVDYSPRELLHLC